MYSLPPSYTDVFPRMSLLSVSLSSLVFHHYYPIDAYTGCMSSTCLAYIRHRDGRSCITLSIDKL